MQEFTVKNWCRYSQTFNKVKGLQYAGLGLGCTHGRNLPSKIHFPSFNGLDMRAFERVWKKIIN